MTDEVSYMLRDYVTDMVRRLEEAQREASEGDRFQLGRKLGLYEALSMFVNRAKAFDVPAEMMGISDIDTDKYI